MGCCQSATPVNNKFKPTPCPQAAKPAMAVHAAQIETKDYQDRMQFLSEVPLMKRLPKDQHPLVASVCYIRDFKPEDAIVTQGEYGDEFFVIRSGTASVHILTEDGIELSKIATLKVGDYFGEKALLRDEPRAATIKAETSLSAFTISRRDFQDLCLSSSLQFANRRAVGGHGQGRAAGRVPTKKTEDEIRFISQALKRNENLATMTTLDDARCRALVNRMWREEVAEGQDIIKEGDLNADYFYVVQEGRFRIFVSEGADKVENGPTSAEMVLSQGESKVVSMVAKGGSFGEMALLYFMPRTATVRAKEKSAVWVIDRSNFKEIMMAVSNAKIEEYSKYLDNVPLLSSLLSDEKDSVAKALAEMQFQQGDEIIQQGEPGNSFYILYEGSVDIIKDGSTVSSLVASASRNSAHYFGERALLDADIRAATVKVTSETAKTLVLDRESFDYVLGPLKDLMEKSKQQGSNRSSMVGKVSRSSLAMHATQKAKEQILRKDLVRIGLLGCGGFGTVELYEHKVSTETYALKGLSKGYIVKTGMQESVMNEKNILMMTNSPFIIDLFETYNGAQSLYFLLEPALGGELYTIYSRRGFWGSQKHAKYYLAGTCLAFEHLHERRIIYRDLKPENLLLTGKGHIKLTDMGLAKFVIGKTYTTCGTPDYFAPEIIASHGHTKAVDWWTLGVLLFELMSGHPPFESANPMLIYAKVMKGIRRVNFPPKCQGHVGALIRSLLKNEPSERLPMRPGGVHNLKSNQWFAGFDWEAMKDLSLDPPFVPVVRSKKDLTNFRSSAETKPRQLQYVDDGTGWDKEFATI